MLLVSGALRLTQYRVDPPPLVASEGIEPSPCVIRPASVGSRWSASAQATYLLKPWVFVCALGVPSSRFAPGAVWPHVTRVIAICSPCSTVTMRRISPALCSIHLSYIAATVGLVPGRGIEPHENHSG